MSKNSMRAIKTARIMFTCIGRRVSLLNSFRHAAKTMKLNLRVLGTDKTNLSSALQLCDEGFLAKPTTHADYIKHLVKIVKAGSN